MTPRAQDGRPRMKDLIFALSVVLQLNENQVHLREQADMNHKCYVRLKLPQHLFHL